MCTVTLTTASLYLHPRSAIEYEMRMMSFIWEAKGRCIEFWIEALRMKENRLIKWAVEESMQMEE